MSEPQAQTVGVVVRVRALKGSEAPEPRSGEDSGTQTFAFPTPQTCEIDGSTFAFDKVFPPNTLQHDIFYSHCNEYVDHFLSGGKAAIIAFGQTAAGKSYTMMGGNTATTRGVIPRTVERIFANYEHHVGLEYIELYNDKPRDLLNLGNPVQMLGTGRLNGVRTYKAETAAQMLAAIARGHRLRSTGATGMNDRSSRSHAIMKLRLLGNEGRFNAASHNVNSVSDNSPELVLVDLAGSEMHRKTETAGQALEEAKCINRSLTSLAMVISALTTKAKLQCFVPYRSSKLTQLLRPYLTGEARTTLIINCSPAATHLRESVSSLRFGSRAKLLKPNVPTEKVRRRRKVMDRWIMTLESAVRMWKIKGAPLLVESWIDLAQAGTQTCLANCSALSSPSPVAQLQCEPVLLRVLADSIPRSPNQSATKPCLSSSANSLNSPTDWEGHKEGHCTNEKLSLDAADTEILALRTELAELHSGTSAVESKINRLHANIAGRDAQEQRARRSVELGMLQIEQFSRGIDAALENIARLKQELATARTVSSERKIQRYVDIIQAQIYDLLVGSSGQAWHGELVGWLQSMPSCDATPLTRRVARMK